MQSRSATQRSEQTEGSTKEGNKEAARQKRNDSVCECSKKRNDTKRCRCTEMCKQRAEEREKEEAPEESKVEKHRQEAEELQRTIMQN